MTNAEKLFSSPLLWQDSPCLSERRAENKRHGRWADVTLPKVRARARVDASDFSEEILASGVFITFNPLHHRSLMRASVSPFHDAASAHVSA